MTMDNKALLWLICNLISIAVLAFYSMLEMACVSFNKVRLQYYVSKGYKRAIWLNYLLHNPSRLFGTTLIGVNIALVIGSECSRQFYASLGLSPDIAPITQVILVVIFGELAPMFAARHYAEHVAMLGVPIIYVSAKLMAPLLWGVGLISKLCNFFVKFESEPNLYLTQEELLKVLEEQDVEIPPEKESAEFTAIAANIFSLRRKSVRQIMDPLNVAAAIPSNATIAQMETVMRKTDVNYLPVYHREISNIIGIAYPRDVLRASDTWKVRDYARPPWFVTETTSIMQILRQFRSNHENVAVILNHDGKAIGLTTLNDVLEEIFGKISYPPPHLPSKQQKKIMLIEKTFSGETTVNDFYKQFGIMLDKDSSLTLAQVMTTHLGHRPEKGESIYIPPFELTAKETTLLDVKTISISTRV